MRKEREGMGGKESERDNEGQRCQSQGDRGEERSILKVR